MLVVDAGPSSAWAHVDVPGGPDPEPDALIIHRENGDLNIVGELDRLANFPA